MKQKKILLLFCFLLLIIFFCNCKKEFIYNFEKEKNINVFGIINANDTIFLHLSFLYNLNQNFLDSNYIINAEIFLYENNVFIEKIKYKNNPKLGDGWYFSSYLPKENNQYKIKVKVPNYDTVYAETSIPDRVNIDSIKYELLIKNEEQSIRSYNLNSFIFFNDVKNTDNFFIINSKQPYITNDPIIESRNTDGFFKNLSLNNYLIAFFSDKLFKNNNYNLKIINEFTFNKDTLCFEYELLSISEEAYLFYKTRYLQDKTSNNPLSEPVIIYSNIINGSGLFAGTSSSSDSIILIKSYTIIR